VVGVVFVCLGGGCSRLQLELESGVAGVGLERFVLE